MSKSVKREKYENIKDKAEQWRDKALEYKDISQTLETENEELLEEIERLDDKLAVDNDEPDQELVRENNILRENVKITKKELRNIKGQYDSRIFDLERQLLRKDAEVDRLKSSLEDYKERYNDYKDEIRLMRRIQR